MLLLHGFDDSTGAVLIYQNLASYLVSCTSSSYQSGGTCVHQTHVKMELLVLKELAHILANAPQDLLDQHVPKKFQCVHQTHVKMEQHALKE